MICIRVLGGYTRAESAETVFDTDDFNEKKYVEYIHSSSGNISLAFNWYAVLLHDNGSHTHPVSFDRYNSFKVMLCKRETAIMLNSRRLSATILLVMPRRLQNLGSVFMKVEDRIRSVFYSYIIVCST